MSSFSICTLASGSSGNAMYAQSPDGAIIIDAGISASAMVKAISAIGGHIDRVDGLVLTHSHSDHSQSAGVMARRHGIPLLMTAGSFAGCKSKIGRNVTPRIFRPGQVLSVGGFHIHTLQTPHDCREPVALILERDNKRCGILTDLGHPFKELYEIMPTLDAVIIESNYDHNMLINGRYPPSLKKRILSANGHISNTEAADLVSHSLKGNLKAVILSHLSESNNHPQIAMDCTREIIRSAQKEVILHVAPRHRPSQILYI